jgi:pimeloyl-ACP methyl ester carboxylesterase
MGHSLGGYLSLAYAIANPTRVDRLVLVSTGPGYRNPHARTEWNGYIDGASASMDLFPGAGKLAHQVDSSVIDGLGDVRVPVLVIAGEDDRRYDAGVDYMMRAIADVELFRVPGAQHHPQRTATNEVNARLMTFLSRQRAVASSGR